MIGKRKLFRLILFIAIITFCVGIFRFAVSNRDFTVFKNKSVSFSFLEWLLPDAQHIMSYASPVFTKSKALKTSEDEEIETNIEEVKIVSKNIASNNLEIKNETAYPIDAASLEKTQRLYDVSGEKPKILIIHTHASETYSNNKGKGLGENGSYRTTDTSKNMVSIGERMAEIFEENKISVIHDKTLCDYPSYNSSYIKSLGVVEWYLERYPQIEFVFDIHRDAIEDSEGVPSKLTCQISKKDAAQAMIVCGTDAMGLSNPFWKDNLILALKIQKNLEEMYPGFMRPLNLRRERFNMHKTKGSLLFEIGTHGNTQLEALRSVEILTEGIIKTLKNK